MLFLVLSDDVKLANLTGMDGRLTVVKLCHFVKNSV